MKRMTSHLALPLIAVAWMVTSAPATLLGQEPATAQSQAANLDWPFWRGPEYNGVSREKNLVESWSPDGENLIWKRDDLGSRSTPIVMNGRLYMIGRDQPETKREGERVVCVDAATGDTIWEHRFNVFLSDVPDTRVGWASVTGDPQTDRIFAMGVCDLFMCLDAKTGDVLWQHSLSEEFGALNTYGGRTNTPIVHENLVIVSAVVIGWGEMAKPTHRLIAFDIRNGQPVWFEGTRVLPYDTTYASPINVVINGQAAIVFGSGDGGFHAFQPRTGKKIWTYNVSRRGLNNTPIYVDGKIYCGHSEENLSESTMGAMFAIDATKLGDITKSGEVWRQQEVMVGKCAPLMIGDKLYVIDDKATLLILDPKTGEQLGRKKLGTQQRSNMLYADGKIYTCTANGRWYILKPDGDDVEVLHRMRFDGEESHGSPIVSHGRLYVPTTGALYCVGDKNAEPIADPRPAAATETSVKEDLTPAHVQIVPVESLLRPGQEQSFQVRLYNANGQFLNVVDASDVEFGVEGAGSVDGQGNYRVPTGEDHHAVIVNAKVGELTGSARIRVVPDFDWNFEFADGQVPVTWVGARYRNIALDYDLLTELTAKNRVAGQLYIYFMTSFINSGRDAAKFDNSTPRQTWNALFRFLEMLDDVKSLDDAKAALDPALAILVQSKVLKAWKWSDEAAVGPQLVVSQGTRGVEGNGVMCKITTIPKGTSSRSWMGHTHFKDYTIQADVLGATKQNKLPDIGIIGQRYNFIMLGASQELQIRTWKPQLRMATTIPFQWKPDVWYTMKMRTAVEGGKAVLRGKVWERDQPEPKEWMIEATDETPNKQGSPGLFGNARDAEIYYDNVRISPNSDG